LHRIQTQSPGQKVCRMPDDLHMLLFDFSGSADIKDTSQDAKPKAPATPAQDTVAKGIVQPDAPAAPGPASNATPKDELLQSLIEQAETISQKIEREVKRILPPTVTVQANIQFDDGSVVITGMVALLKWAAPIVGDAAKKELGELVKLAIKRVLSRYLTPFSASLTELNVTSQSSTPDRTSRTFADKISATTALLVITGLILILQLVTLLVHLRS